MQDDVRRLQALLGEGKCCAVALVQLALESRNEKNDQLLQAVSGLCAGVHGGLLCGAFTGAACMMNVMDPENANTLLVPELAEWFTESIGRDYGGTDCTTILHGDMRNRKAICPELIETVYLKAKEIMHSHGVE